MKTAHGSKKKKTSALNNDCTSCVVFAIATSNSRRTRPGGLRGQQASGCDKILKPLFLYASRSFVEGVDLVALLAGQLRSSCLLWNVSGSPHVRSERHVIAKAWTLLAITPLLFNGISLRLQLFVALALSASLLA